jgi:hypothetical protein
MLSAPVPYFADLLVQHSLLQPAEAVCEISSYCAFASWQYTLGFY